MDVSLALLQEAMYSLEKLAHDHAVQSAASACMLLLQDTACMQLAR